MLYGYKTSDLTHFQDQTLFSVQTDNGIESILRKAGVTNWLETCGPTSGKNACAYLDYNTTILLPGGGKIQGEDGLAIWMNEPENYPAELTARQNIDPNAYEANEIPQFYSVALPAVFGARAEFAWTNWDDVVSRLKTNRCALMICLKNPGHFLCVVAYDDSDNTLIYRDSWPRRTGTTGFNLKMPQTEFVTNVQPFLVAVFAKG